jgi:diadenosine tetraphosphatase ApaH/serine/threonine PP2A family protein phosphatase
MLIAILSDIHANREAFDACLADARQVGAEQFVLLGDLVGYGADPAYVIEVAVDMQARGAIVIKGNHDEAASDKMGDMNIHARLAVEWTRAVLNPAQKHFLAGLPFSVEQGEVLYVHSEAADPASWIYVMDEIDADRSMDATEKRITFCGHVHRPQLYYRADDETPGFVPPSDGAGICLAKDHKWHVVVGSVGQPRDEIPAAAYALYDDVRHMLTFQRVAYDIERAANKIKAAGLPEILALRLFVGR